MRNGRLFETILGTEAGKIEEEISKIMENIQDGATGPTEKRVLKIEVAMTPDADRSRVDVKSKISSVLAPAISRNKTIALDGTDLQGSLFTEWEEEEEET